MTWDSGFFVKTFAAELIEKDSSGESWDEKAVVPPVFGFFAVGGNGPSQIEGATLHEDVATLGGESRSIEEVVAVIAGTAVAADAATAEAQRRKSCADDNRRMVSSHPVQTQPLALQGYLGAGVGDSTLNDKYAAWHAVKP